MNPATPNRKFPVLPAGSLETVFPFYLHWDRELRLCSVGRSLMKALPEAVAGTPLQELFKLRRPVGELGPALFHQDGSLLFLFESIPNGMLLRGLILELDAGDGYLMLTKPWIADPDEIGKFGLTLDDFAAHDQTMDMLQVVQTHRMTIEDLKLLNKKLTEQRALLQEQRAEARKLALVVSRTDNAVIISDNMGRIEWVNEGFNRLTGLTLSEVIGKTLGSLLQGPDTDPATVQYMRDHLRRGEGFQTEVFNYSKDGRRYWISIEVQPIHDEHGKLQNFMAVESDITERRLADQRRSLQLSVSKLLTGRPTESEAMVSVLETICSTLNWNVGNAWRWDSNSGLLRLEETWQQPSDHVDCFVESSRVTTFKPGDDLPGRTWLTRQGQWIPDLASDSKFLRMKQAASAGLRAGLALPIITEGEVWGVLEFFNSNIEEPDRKLLETLTSIGGMIGQFVVRKEAEEALRKSKEIAEAANLAKSDFLATMSHEIRTPMNGVLGFAQLLAQSPLSEEQRDFVSSIHSSSEALLHIINDVLDFSKIESGNMVVETQPFSIETCVDEALETISTVALEKNLDLAGRIAPDVPHVVVGDSHRLRQILVNLLGNAVKFTASGEVRLEVNAEPSANGTFRIRFTICDTGIGIQEDRLSHLFEPFHQEDSSTTRRFGGTGLGLAICRRLVELMGGRIEVSSKPGEGSQFRFELPMAPSNETSSGVDALPLPDFSGLRALVVDAHRWSRQVIEERLQRWGMEVSSVTSMADADHDWKPGLILMNASAAAPEASEAFFRANPQAHVYLLCRPTYIHELRSHFGDLVAGMVSKPVKMAHLCHLLLAKVAGKSENQKPEASPAAQAVSEHYDRKVLLVEDNLINRKLALALLAQIGCIPDIAMDGQDAVGRATSTSYDVILMDLQMPGMDGLEATRKIRQWEQENAASRARIIALTANALAGDREICLKAGMDDYLTKPINFHTLRGLWTRTAARSVPHAPAGQSGRTLEQLVRELSKDDVMMLATEFMEDLDQLLDQIRTALQLTNLNEAQRLAHSLKGSASIFALEELRDTAFNLEKACAAGDNSATSDLMSALEVSIKRATTELGEDLKSIIANTTMQEPIP
ncbi:MAG: ATP-binding protein [Akkermansiaceae bacterium]|jgi:PAS domain S-box-containing protein